MKRTAPFLTGVLLLLASSPIWAESSFTGPSVDASTSAVTIRDGIISTRAASVSEGLRLKTESMTEETQDIINGQGFSVNSGSITLASNTQNNPALYLMNPSTSSMLLFHSAIRVASLNHDTPYVFRVWYNPTGVTGGKQIIPVNRYAGSTNSSRMTVYVSPTVTTSGNEVAFYLSDNSMVMDHVYGNYIVPPGNSLLITGQPSTVNKQCEVNIQWVEEP